MIRRLRKYCSDFWSVREGSFDVKRGETLGIIGRNGSGKSTLLQVIAGIMEGKTIHCPVRHQKLLGGPLRLLYGLSCPETINSYN